MKAAATGYFPIVIGVLILLSLVLGYWGYTASEARLAAVSADYEIRLVEATDALARAENENRDLAGSLQAERERNDNFENQINDISGTVGKLDKLSRTDAELLQKYSKIYFLNENYSPVSVVEIDEEYVYGEEEYFHEEAWPFLKDLLEDAEEDGVELKVVSGFRSFGTQAALKANYRVTYGSGANTFSADQGYSEHQLGTTIDFTTEAIGSTFSGFENTESYQWLLNNAHRYGFVLSYPDNNAYYQYEPWHWRFVGVDLARDLHRDEKSFYDLDQREIDTYLIKLFD
ncbi:M15 family metallopeptidase [Patescibacteria group bacterium]|nr:M15 family metallopeptidase [Patescibacteria group bacterium]